MNEVVQVSSRTLDHTKRIEGLEKNRSMMISGNIPEVHVTCTGNNMANDQMLPKFTGRAINPREYLEKIRKYYRKMENGRSPQQSSEQELLCETIEASLEQQASRWWQLIKGDVRTWEDFEQIFLEKYWSREVQQGIRKRIEVERYRTGGRLTRSEYFIDRVITLNSMLPRMEEDEIVTIMAEHFSQTIQDARRVQNLTTVRDFESLLQRKDLVECRRNPREQQPQKNIPSSPRNERYPAGNDPRRGGSRPQFQSPRIDYHAYLPRHFNRDQNTQRCPLNRNNFRNNQPGYQQQQPYRHQEGNHYLRQNYDNQYRPYNTNQNGPRREQPYPTQEQKTICRIIAEDRKIDHDNPPARQETSPPPLNC